MATTQELAMSYAALIKVDSGNINWNEINENIIEEYGKTKLISVKKLAWKILQRVVN